MKVETEKKKAPKWIKFAIIGAVVLVVIIVVIAILKGSKSGGNIYDKLNSFTAQETGNFRYILNVRSSDHEESSAGITLEEYMDKTGEGSGDAEGENGENANAQVTDTSQQSDYMDYEDQDEGRSQTGKLYADKINQAWSSADGSKVVSWDYPNYEIIITGRTESVEPLKSVVNIRVSTDYTGADFLKLVFLDEDCYVDVKTLRDWLLKAGDSNLVKLADSLPDSAVYMHLANDELKFITPYAEVGEEEMSGARGIKDFYRRIIIIEKVISQSLSKSLGSAGYTEEGNKTRLSLSGDNAAKLLSAVKSLVANAGNGYDIFQSSLVKNKMVDEAQATQLTNEKDNFMYHISDFWRKLSSISSEDLEKMDLRVVGKTNNYNASTGGAVSEVNLGVGFTSNNIDYIITFYGCKQDLSVTSNLKVAKPSEAITEYADYKNYDFEYVKNYLMYYFKLIGNANGYKLTTDLNSMEDRVLADFVEVVNAKNEELKGGVSKQNLFTIRSYIGHYLNMSEEDASINAVNQVNYDLVKEFIAKLDSFKTFTENSGRTSGLDESQASEAAAQAADGTKSGVEAGTDAGKPADANGDKPVDANKGN